MSKCVQLNKQTKLKTEEEKTKNPSFGFRGKKEGGEKAVKLGGNLENLEKMRVNGLGFFFSVNGFNFCGIFKDKKLSFGFSGKKKGKNQ